MSKRPRWSNYVKDAHACFLRWHAAGKPHNGNVYEIMKRTRSLFKASLRHC